MNARKHPCTRSAWLAIAAILLTVLVVPAAPAQTATDPAPLQFESPAEEKRFHALAEDLRCVMCQNQSLADSNAQIALDLRREVLGLMREGRSDTEIEAFLVARYGEFVLYRPRAQGVNWLLWLAPLIFVAAGVWMLLALLRRHRRNSQAPQLHAAEKPRDDDGQEW